MWKNYWIFKKKEIKKDYPSTVVSTCVEDEGSDTVSTCEPPDELEEPESELEDEPLSEEVELLVELDEELEESSVVVSTFELSSLE